MLLLYGIWALITSAELAVLASLDDLQQQFVCIDQACYSISWASRKYARARRDCQDNKQHLMTVKNSEQTHAISLLISKVKSYIKVWIGLEPIKGCTDPKLPLRGFTWVTGDSYPASITWNDNEQKCATSGDLCVTVNNNGTCEETDCTSKSNGLLCESSHSAFCSPLTLPEDYKVIYVHPSHGIGLSLSNFYPPGTSVHLSPNQDDLFCEDKEDGQVKWNRKTPGAWPCMIDNGGCDHECVVGNGTPECKCPQGSKLKEDKRSCSLSCDPTLCSRCCDPTSIPLSSPYRCPEGYYLAKDGKICVNNDCEAHPNICGYYCTNSSGGFTCECKTGFKKVPFDFENPDEWGVKCQAVDECEKAMCEHMCETFHGGYKCVCNHGYVLDKNNPKKCKRVCNASECEAECNEKGECRCPEGYILENAENKGKCVDVDECLDGSCHWDCTNLFGGFECICPKGYTLHSAECVPDGTEGPGGVTIDTTSSGSFPQITFSIEPTVLIGICIGIISILAVLIAMVCHMLRKHYMDQHDFDYKLKSTEKYVVLQQVKTIPQWRL
ncbi:PREDICTED: thrombomodulin-like [Nanorana parkeri]|uniref:thrombomodulin-like n=1 Tax=Nanorana parkeri TaxID=125878 RepID=UPI0008545FE5|nr:PREDICTED: thrombomodulin-like [Nanorana parkeri]